MKAIRTLSVLALVLAPLGAAAQQRAAAGPKPLVIVARNQTAAAEAARGAARRTTQARQGDVLRYQLTFTNVAGRPVRGVVISDPIPAGLRFVPGSVKASRADAVAEYSIDGGRTFSAQPMEEVAVNGQRVQRPAAPEKYTHVRWTVGGWVAPGATVTAEFDARLGAPPAPAPGTAATPAAGSNGGQ